MSDLRERLREAFRAECGEYADGIRAAAGGPPPAVADAYRMAHSLKSAASVCDHAAVARLAGRLETLLGRACKSDAPLAPEPLAAVAAAADALSDWVRAAAAGGPEPDLSAATAAVARLVSADAPPAKPAPPPADDLTRRLREAFQAEQREHLDEMRAGLAEVEAGTAAADRVDDIFRRAHSLKGAARIADLKPVEDLAHRLESLFARVRGGELALGPDAVRAVRVALDAIEDCAARADAGRPMPDTAAAHEQLKNCEFRPAVAAPETRSSTDPAVGDTDPPQDNHQPSIGNRQSDAVRVSAAHLDGLLRSAGQLLAEGQRQGVVDRELTSLGRQVNDLEREWGAMRSAAAGEWRRLAATPEFARLARHLAAVEQQVHSLARATRAVRRLHRRGVRALQLFGGQLQQDARRVRMAAAGSVFQGFGTLVRDLAQAEGKEVDYRAHGLDVRADRAVLQALKDPLMHALTNAVTHGVEEPAGRRAAGKPAAGRVSLSIEAAGGRLVVRVADDGRGIDPRAVAAEAVRRGLVSAAEAAGCSADEAARLIFRPGFSTARAVTARAGRGMGLSVVFEAAAKLQGEVDLDPRPGPGTCVRVTVPLSVASRRLLLVGCGGQTFAVPAESLERLVRATPRDVEAVGGRPMLMVGGRPVPVAFLAHLLGLPPAPPGPVVLLAVVKTGARRTAVVVDAFVAEVDAVVKPLDPPAAGVAAFAGGVVRDDGTVSLVLNPAAVLGGGRAAAAAPAAAAPAPAVPPAGGGPRTVMVVDDSLTTRTLEKSILEAHGYRVRVAVDGAEALDRLKAEPADLVITDVEMPRMTGFQLLEALKADPKLSRVPVIVVTSLARREDQEKGLSLGADAYIVKRKFDHEELLATIRQIL